ncbi:MAG TPA: hypothetical protein ENJ50_00085 [Planctomycetaceae bacterium]|nr:hypothetical protein [Planctomycetaceae bacterium]
MIADNPFAACHIDPRAQPVAPKVPDIDAWLERLRRARPGVFLLVGPHGCGKTWHLASLERAVRDRFPATPMRWLNADRTPFAKACHLFVTARRKTWWFVDGLDRWSHWERRFWCRLAKLRQGHVIGTTHELLRGTVLARFSPSPEQLCRIVRRLVEQANSKRTSVPHFSRELETSQRFTPASQSFSMPADQPICPPRALILRLYHIHSGNYRQVFADLYDWWEAMQGHHPDPRTLPASLLRAVRETRGDAFVFSAQIYVGQGF